MADFVLDVLRPSVIKLDEDNFEELVGSKTEDQMWLVDFYGDKVLKICFKLSIKHLFQLHGVVLASSLPQSGGNCQRWV